MKAAQVLPDIWHIETEMNVCITLICGSERALLVDTGYGLSDVAAFVKTLTTKPVTVVLTHGHHDHVIGARWFEESFMFEEDLSDFATFTAEAQRRKIVLQAQENGIEPPEDYLTRQPRTPRALQEGVIDLGGLTAEIIHCPGHTPGSAVIYVPQRALLLTADDWNPCTWLFFPTALGAQDYRTHVRKLLELPFTKVLCSHRTQLYDRSMLERFLNGLTDDCLRAARRVDMGWPVDTREASPADDQIFVFDWNKTTLKEI